jgi:hypothetical protein
MPRRSNRPALRLFAVVVEDERTGALDRVLLEAARTMEGASEMARAFYLVDRPAPLPYAFAAQPIAEVSGPGGAVYRIVLRRRAGGPA